MDLEATQILLTSLAWFSHREHSAPYAPCIPKTIVPSTWATLPQGSLGLGRDWCRGASFHLLPTATGPTSFFLTAKGEISPIQTPQRLADQKTSGASFLHTAHLQTCGRKPILATAWAYTLLKAGQASKTKRSTAPQMLLMQPIPLMPPAMPSSTSAPGGRDLLSSPEQEALTSWIP